MTHEGNWLTSSQAASALAVQRSTLYAYVSRGRVASRSVRDDSGRRVSLFARSDIVALAAARNRPRAGDLSVLIESDVTELGSEGTFLLRGRPIAEWVASTSFEDAARRVLETQFPWPTVGAVRLGDVIRRTDRIRAALVLAAGQDPHRDRLDADHCRRVAMQAVAVGCAAVDGVGSGSGTTTATSLAAALGRSVDPRVIRCVEVALIVLIDHELTASTLATRAAAGVRADPWMAILAGQCAMSGSAQAGASSGALQLVRRWRRSGGATALSEPLWGFGRRIYTGPDPRFELLLAEVAVLDDEVADDVERLCVQVARTYSRHPNVDLALAALMIAANMPADAGEVLFTLARTIGLACHAIEEYPHGLRLRPRALGTARQQG